MSFYENQLQQYLHQDENDAYLLNFLKKRLNFEYEYTYIFNFF